MVTSVIATGSCGRSLLSRGARDDLVDDVHALRHLAEQRVVLRQLAGQVVVQMKNWLPFVFGPALAIASAPRYVVALDRLVLELVAGAARADAAALERRLLAVLAVAALDDEARG